MLRKKNGLILIERNSPPSFKKVKLPKRFSLTSMISGIMAIQIF